MKMLTKKEFLPIVLIILAFLVGILLYPYLPDRIPSHWNAQGEIDSWTSKNFFILFFPSLTLIIYLLMIFLPLIDPLKENYSKFSKSYFWIRVLLVSLFVLLYFYALWSGFNNGLDINSFIIVIFSIFFIILGILIPKIKKNYFVGIRTPWTIHSEQVWEKTHLFSGKLFILAGIVSLLGFLITDQVFFVFLVSVISAALLSIIYSYFVFRKLK